MEIYVNGECIYIDIEKNPYAKGSEGRLYKKDDKLYKIYYDNSLSEGFGKKEVFHKSLLEFNDVCETFILPVALEFDKDKNYVGYVCKIVGDGNKKFYGISELNWDSFLANLKDIEKEKDFLTDNRFLLTDIGIHNAIFSKVKSKIYLVDPGRYHHEKYFTLEQYRKINNLMLKDFFKNLLKQEAIFYKLVKPKKATPLLNTIFNDITMENVSDYFAEISTNYENVQEFMKIKARYLK